MTADHLWVSIRSLSRDSVAWSRLRLVQPTRPGVSNSTRFFQHQPVLDGVRGLAWFAVFLGHAGLAPGLAIGQVAMFVFFGLSGFLITTVLSVERIRTGHIRLRKFYARRALRLVPALVAFLAVWVLVVAIFGHESWVATVPGSSGASNGVSFSVAVEGAVGALTYLTNWCGLFNIFSGYVPLGHLWSLAVEEQFYLLWAPLLVVLIAVRRRVATATAFLLAAASFVDVVVLQHAHSTTPWVFYSTDTRSGAFLVGGGVGLLWSDRRALATWWSQVCTPVAAVGPGGVGMVRLGVRPSSVRVNLRNRLDSCFRLCASKRGRPSRPPGSRRFVARQSSADVPRSPLIRALLVALRLADVVPWARPYRSGVGSRCHTRLRRDLLASCGKPLSPAEEPPGARKSATGIGRQTFWLGWGLRQVRSA